MRKLDGSSKSRGTRVSGANSIEVKFGAVLIAFEHNQACRYRIKVEFQMPTILTATPPAALPIEPPRKLWTRDQCEQLEKAGWLELLAFETLP